MKLRNVLAAALLLAPLLAAAQSIDTCWSHQVNNTITTGIMSLSTDIWADGNGNVYACGASDHPGSDNEDMAVVRYNEWGDTLWVRYVDGPESGDDGDIARALAVDSVGNVYIAGQTESDLSDLDMTVAKFDSAGTLLWTWRSGWEDPDGLYDIIITPQGGVYACGTLIDPDTLYDAFAVVRLNPASGDTVWLRRYILDSGADHGRRLGVRPEPIDMYWDFFDEWNDFENCATALAYSPSDGKVVATGFGLHSDRDYQAWTMKFSNDGTRDWQRTDSRTAQGYDDAAFDVVVANSGRVYIAGLDENSNDGYNFSVVYITATGGDGTRATIDGGIDWDEWATALCLDDSATQNVYATGFLQVNTPIIPPMRQAFTMKFASDLTQRWSTSEGSYGATFNEIGYDIAYCDGFVYVGCETDNTSPDGPSDGMVLCYNTTNSSPLAWAKDRVDFAPSPSCEYVTGIAVTGPDHIYLSTQTYPNWYGDRSRSQMWNCRLFTPDRDVRMEGIVAPTGRVTYLDTVTPQVAIINEGNYRMDVSCRFWIQPGFRDTVLSARLLPAETALVNFRDWVAQPIGSLAVRCSLAAAYDNDPYNNALTDTVEVVSHDVGCFRVTAPTAQMDSGAVVSPTAWFRNYGAGAETFNARLVIGTGYDDTVSVTLNPLDSIQRTFPSFTARERGLLAVRCSTLLATDISAANDLAVESVFVRVLDASATAIVAPTGTIDSGSSLVPRASITNRGNTLVTLTAKFDINPSFDGDGTGGRVSLAGLPVNSGGTAELDDYSSTVVVSNLGAGEVREVSFDLWTASGHGAWATKCSTRLTGDMAAANDRTTGTVQLRVSDVAVVQVNQPVGTYSPNTIVNPSATWRNTGTVAADFSTWMLIADPGGNRVYTDRVDVAGLAPATDTALAAFAPCTLATLGFWTVRCSTYMAGDMNPVNNFIDRFFSVTENPDIGMVAIVAPAGNVDTGTVVTPLATARNFGDASAGFRTWLAIRTPGDSQVYRQSFDVSSLAPGAETTMAFPDWEGAHSRGFYTVRCSLAIDDVQPVNDTMTGRFYAGQGQRWPYGWVEVKPMPSGNLARAVKRGGALCVDEGDSALLYATKGYKTFEFYSYNMFLDAWDSLASVPLGAAGRAPDKGACLESDEAGHVYLVRGNNTAEFWRYEIARDTWERMADVPLGTSGKRVKGGTDITRVVRDDTTWLYLLKGYRNEFYKYSTLTNEWVSCPDAPVGVKYKWDKGSWIVDDNELTIYAHKAKYYNRSLGEHELWKYDCRGDSWYSQQLHGMPLVGLHSGRIKSKKAKDGGSADWYDGGLYALKGGNTQQFFRYEAVGDTWRESDTMPTFGSSGKKRRVKQGGDMVYTTAAFWALKGNKTLELWRYGLDPGTVAATPPPARSGVAGAAGLLPGGWEFDVRPNPLSGGGALHYAVPYATTVSARLYDATGRAVKTLLSARPVAGRGAVRLDAAGLARGVYLLRLDAAGGFTRTFKVVIE